MIRATRPGISPGFVSARTTVPWTGQLTGWISILSAERRCFARLLATRASRCAIVLLHSYCQILVSHQSDCDDGLCRQCAVHANPVEVVLSQPLPTKSPRIDGRRLRSERTKQLIIEAFLALVREDPKVPTAVQIAERAGYSVRSVFERFPDLNALRVAATDYALAQAAALAPARHVDADRATRVESQVDTRAQTCERGVSLWRVLTSSQEDSEELR